MRYVVPITREEARIIRQRKWFFIIFFTPPGWAFLYCLNATVNNGEENLRKMIADTPNQPLQIEEGYEHVPLKKSFPYNLIPNPVPLDK